MSKRKSSSPEASRVQLVSDLHLDTRSYPPRINLPRVAPTIIIAGDLCPVAHPHYQDFLREVTEGFQQAIYVPGNHEFYGAPDDPPSMMNAIKRACDAMNTPTHLLGIDYPSVELTRKVRVVGATMWTDVDDGLDPMLNDFNQVPSLSYGNRGDAATTNYFRSQASRFTPGDMGLLHRLDKGWLLQEMHEAKEDGKKVLVVTHHSPDRRLSVVNDSRAGGGYGPFYYASDMTGVMKSMSNNILAWCYGHTHESHAITLPDSRVVCITNAMGYPQEKTGYTPGFCFTV